MMQEEAIVELRLLAQAYHIANEYDAIPSQEYADEKGWDIPKEIIQKYEGYSHTDIVGVMLRTIEMKL